MAYDASWDEDHEGRIEESQPEFRRDVHSVRWAYLGVGPWAGSVVPRCRRGASDDAPASLLARGEYQGRA